MTTKVRIQRVPINNLIVDMRVQRPLDSNRANNIAAKLNKDAIGVLCVSSRDDGTYSIIDGQHRAEALRISGLTNETVQCEVYTGLSLADEAAMFRLRNNTTKPTYLDKFRVRLVEGDEQALAVMDYLRKYGWLLPGQDGNAKGRFSAVYALERIHAIDSEAAERTIGVVTSAWGHIESAVDGRIVDGVGSICARYSSMLDVQELIEKLSKFPGGASALIGRARGLSSMLGVSLPNAVAEIVVEIYNKRKTSRALPPWRAS